MSLQDIALKTEYRSFPYAWQVLISSPDHIFLYADEDCHMFPLQADLLIIFFHHHQE